MDILEFYEKYIKEIYVLNDTELDILYYINLFGLIIKNSDNIHKLVVINYVHRLLTIKEKISIVYVNDDFQDMYDFCITLLKHINHKYKTFGLSHSYRPFKSIIMDNLSQIKFYKVFSVIEEYDEATIVDCNQNLKTNIQNYFTNCRTGNVTIITTDENQLNNFPIDLFPTFFQREHGIGFSTHNKNNPIKNK